MWTKTLAVAIPLGILGLAQLTCHQALLTAPPGSTISLFANPTIIPANGGVSVISAFLLEPAGTPVPDGTVVQFFTNLGRIPEQGKTNDGVARVNLVSDSRSGVARVTAFSGGGTGAPAPAPTGSPAPTPGGGTTSTTVEVTIGNLNAASLLLTADPPAISLTGTSYLTANVADEDGNPVKDAPVIFQVTAGAEPGDRLDSGGSPRFTDNDGRAFDAFRARRTVVRGTGATVTIEAAVPGIAAATDTVTITIR